MDCISVVCMYFAVSLSATDRYILINDDPVKEGYTVSNVNRGGSYGTLGNAALGIEYKGLFLELDHTSSIETNDDVGWEEIRLGYRKNFSLGK